MAVDNRKRESDNRNRAKLGPEDRSRIDLSAHYEIDFWTSRFDCSEADLRDAVNRLGTCAQVVKRFLRNRAEQMRDRVEERIDAPERH